MDRKTQHFANQSEIVDAAWALITYEVVISGIRVKGSNTGENKMTRSSRLDDPLE
jgi:hypothetical protein